MIKTSGPENATLENVTLLRGLPSAELDRLATLCRWQTWPAEHKILSKGSHGQEVYFVVRGSVSIATYADNSREVTLAIANEGDFFGELAAIDDMPRSASAVTIEKSLIACLAQKHFLDLVKQHDVISLRLLKRLALKIRESGVRILELSTFPAAQRVYATILRLAQPDKAVANLWVVRPFPPMRDIANLASTTRESVSRALGQLYRMEILKKKGHNLYIMNQKKLEDLVKSMAGHGDRIE